MAELIYPKLSYKLIGILFEVQNKVGYKLRESTYQSAIAIKLEENKIPFKTQVRYKLLLDDKLVKELIADFIIDDKIILEIKAKERFNLNDISQVYDYLKATGLRLGIIANFSNNEVKFKRIINKISY